MSGSAFAVTHHAFSSGAGRTSDGNGSHASTLKSPSYTKSVSWQHYPARGTVEEIEGFIQAVTPDARGKDNLSENAITVDIAVSYYRQTLDGRELFAIDTERFSRRVNGVDMLSGLAAKVRL
ncbi:phage major tail tube protein [Escherichia coli]